MKLFGWTFPQDLHSFACKKMGGGGWVYFWVFLALGRAFSVDGEEKEEEALKWTRFGSVCLFVGRPSTE